MPCLDVANLIYFISKNGKKILKLKLKNHFFLIFWEKFYELWNFATKKTLVLIELNRKSKL
jgi:hypothetical protein